MQCSIDLTSTVKAGPITFRSGLYTSVGENARMSGMYPPCRTPSLTKASDIYRWVWSSVSLRLKPCSWALETHVTS